MVTKLAAGDEVCRRLMSVAGVGPVTALSFKAAVDDPSRLRRWRTLGAHFGLTPRRIQSGEVGISGHISKRCYGYLRTLLRFSEPVGDPPESRRSQRRLRATNGRSDPESTADLPEASMSPAIGGNLNPFQPST